MRKVVLILIFLLVPIFVGAQSNAGFVNNFWYSRLPFFAGETVRIYTAVQNSSGQNISGVIKFFNNGEIIGESSFSADDGRLIQKWVDWKATSGNHKFQVKLFDVKNSSGEVVSLSNTSSVVDEKFVDLDTDNDRIGNKDDPDDDNDGISDVQEKKDGTNPLVFNSPVGNETKVVDSMKEEKTGEESTLEKSKNVAENFVVEPAKKVTSVVLAESKPVIKRIGNLLEEKQLAVEKKIEEDRSNQNSNLAAAGSSKFYDKIREKLPPVFRILYSWLLKFLVLVFKVWWIPFIVFLLIVFRILLGFWRRYRYR